MSQEGKKVLQNMQKEIDKINVDKNEEVSRFKNHSEKLLSQIKKLKKDKKSLENKVQQLIEKEASNVGIQVDDKTTNTDRVNMTTQEDKSVKETTHVDVAVQTMNIPSECSITNLITSSPEENLKTLYRHPNHKIRQLNQATYQDHSEQKQQTNVPENNDITSIQSYANKSLQNSSDQNTIQKISLGWSNPFSVRKFCLSLRRSYQLVSTRMTIPRKKDFRSRKRDQAFFIDKL